MKVKGSSRLDGGAAGFELVGRLALAAAADLVEA